MRDEVDMDVHPIHTLQPRGHAIQVEANVHPPRCRISTFTLSKQEDTGRQRDEAERKR